MKTSEDIEIVFLSLYKPKSVLLTPFPFDEKKKKEVISVLKQFMLSLAVYSPDSCLSLPAYADKVVHCFRYDHVQNLIYFRCDNTQLVCNWKLRPRVVSGKSARKKNKKRFNYYTFAYHR